MDFLANLGPLPYVILASLTTLGLVVGRVLGKKSAIASRIADLVEKLKTQVVSYERIDKSVEAVLTSYGIPRAFADWVGDCLAGLITKIPEFMHATSAEQKIDVVSSVFAAAPQTQIERATMNLFPKDVISQDFAKKRIARSFINASADLTAMVRDAGKATGSGNA